MSVDASSTTPIETPRSRIAGAIRQASNSTGASFEYLVATAKMESDLNPVAAAPTSSAKGLYQFIDQTWLGTVKEAGAQFGYGDFADAITKSASGTYSVSDPTTRAAVLRLRNDPVASAAMAGVLTQSNSFSLTGKIGRRPTDGELYMAHFMGVGGAGKLISNAENNPNASGARLFPNAAAANRLDLLRPQRQAAQRFGGLFGADLALCRRRQFPRPRARRWPPRALAQPAAPTRPPAPCRAGQRDAVDRADRQCRLSVELPRCPRGYAGDRDVRLGQRAAASPPQTDPIFRSLFQGGDRSAPVSPAVQELWGNRSSLTSASAAPSGAPRRLDLFSDRAGTFARRNRSICSAIAPAPSSQLIPLPPRFLTSMRAHRAANASD